MPMPMAPMTMGSLFGSGSSLSQPRRMQAAAEPKREPKPAPPKLRRVRLRLRGSACASAPRPFEPSPTYEIFSRVPPPQPSQSRPLARNVSHQRLAATADLLGLSPLNSDALAAAVDLLSSPELVGLSGKQSLPPMSAADPWLPEARCAPKQQPSRGDQMLPKVPRTPATEQLDPVTFLDLIEGRGDCS